jgi:hypothetical protein
MIGIKRCGYTPYGYGVRINNRLIEFATESELDEWIGEDDYGFTNDVQVCLLGCDRRIKNIN